MALNTVLEEVVRTDRNKTGLEFVHTSFPAMCQQHLETQVYVWRVENE